MTQHENGSGAHGKRQITMTHHEWDCPSSTLLEIDGRVVLRILDRTTGKRLLDIEIDPDEADEMASDLIRIAARARRDGVHR